MSIFYNHRPARINFGVVGDLRDEGSLSHPPPPPKNVAAYESIIQSLEETNLDLVDDWDADQKDSYIQFVKNLNYDWPYGLRNVGLTEDDEEILNKTIYNSIWISDTPKPNGKQLRGLLETWKLFKRYKNDIVNAWKQLRETFAQTAGPTPPQAAPTPPQATAPPPQAAPTPPQAAAAAAAAKAADEQAAAAQAAGATQAADEQAAADKAAQVAAAAAKAEADRAAKAQADQAAAAAAEAEADRATRAQAAQAAAAAAQTAADQAATAQAAQQKAQSNVAKKANLEIFLGFKTLDPGSQPENKRDSYIYTKGKKIGFFDPNKHTIYYTEVGTLMKIEEELSRYLVNRDFKGFTYASYDKFDYVAWEEKVLNKPEPSAPPKENSAPPPNTPPPAHALPQDSTAKLISHFNRMSIYTGTKDLPPTVLTTAHLDTLKFKMHEFYKYY